MKDLEIKDIFDNIIFKGAQLIKLSSDENSDTCIEIHYEAMGDFNVLYNNDESKSYINSNDFIRNLSIHIECTDIVTEMIKNHISLYDEDREGFKSISKFILFLKEKLNKEIRMSTLLEYNHNIIFDEEISSEFIMTLKFYDRQSFATFTKNISEKALQQIIDHNNSYGDYDKKIKEIEEGNIIYENDKNTNN